MTQELERFLELARARRLNRREFARQALALGASPAVLLSGLFACRADERRGSVGAPLESPPLGPIEPDLHIYNWADYIPPEIIPSFEQEFGVKVTYDEYETNEEMLLNLQAGVKGYDVVVPTGWQVQAMAALGLLRPLSRLHLSNWSNISSDFVRQPTTALSAYAVPYQWGITGLAYRRDRLREPVQSWGVLLERRYRDHMTMLNERREVIGSMLRYRGHSLNSTHPGQLEQAKTDAIEAKRNLRGYLSVQVKPYLLAGDVWVAQLYNGYTRRLEALEPAIAFSIPREGCTIYTDFLCIPASAPNPRAAHEFINYLLRPAIGANLSRFTGYGTPNAASAKLLDNSVPYPKDLERRGLEYQVDLGEANAVWDRVWEEIRQA